MKGYGQFCPIAMASEIFAERWTPLILRELLFGSSRFAEIRRGVPLISSAMLSQRLRTLEDAGLVKSRPLGRGRGREYLPTEAARELRGVLDGLGTWGQRWAKAQFDLQNLDVGFLLWNMRRRVDVARLPAHRVVVRFDFRNLPARCAALRSCWLILDRRGSEVCLKNPMFDVDLTVATDAATMARVWMGATTFAAALRSGGLRIEGPRHFTRSFPSWFLLSAFAPHARSRRLRGTTFRGG